MKFGQKSAPALFILFVGVGIIAVLGPGAVADYFITRLFVSSTLPSNEVVVWHPWGAQNKEQIEELFREFNRTHSPLKVKSVFASNGAGGAGGSQKFFTSIAAGKTPDVIFVDSSQVAEWAFQGALEPLDERIAAAGIRMDDFFKPAWKSCAYDGRVWALTYCADPNFAFAWNKDVFARAGLDPEQPPRSIDELDRMNDRITASVNGKLRTLGLIPWGQFGGANSIFTWGWVFGGDFYDEANHRITANDPRIVRALEWMCSYASKYDITRINSLTAGFGSLDRNPFYIGEMGMTCFHIFQISDAGMYAPKLNYGLAPIPYPQGGEPNSSWIGGWCMGLPKGSRRAEAGWELIRWICADPEGTLAVGKIMSLFPGYRKSPYFDIVRNDPRYGIYVSIIDQSKHQRPVMPAVDYYMGALDRAVQFVLYGQKNAKQALDDATFETQRELDFKLAGK
ncbi:MAG: ABC transporter substrate-binding protein [bacterium]|nr:ABC transporter substrate-binding protein [Candidatus Sumerlaeota bacterium]